jgi:ATP-dependent DNA helicase PIF1
MNELQSVLDELFEETAIKKPEPTHGLISPEGKYLPFEGYILDEDAQRAFDLVMSGNQVTFITGSGGVGKSSLLRYIRYNTSRNVVVVAPTGVAALNAEGVTINSFFWFPPHMLQQKDVKFRRDEVITNLELMIIDEVSMVRADVMDMIDYALQKWRNNSKPFGGLQMVFVGDLYQLCPIVKRGSEEQIIKDRYPNGHYFFNAEVFDRVKMATVELKHVYRQSDAHFIGVLNKIRTGSDVMSALSELNTLCVKPVDKKAIILTATNEVKDQINNRMFDKLEGEEFVYESTQIGDVRNTDDRYPSPELLVLKEGCRVMVTKNTLDGSVVNGSLGTVVKCDPSSVDVDLDDGRPVRIFQETWQTYKYDFDKKEKKIDVNITGEYKQIPLVLAYAISIHKSQGLSFDAVNIHLGRGAFTYGQAYVALSRCRNLNQLVFVNEMVKSDIMVDEIVSTFYEKALTTEKAVSYRVVEETKAPKFMGKKVRGKTKKAAHIDEVCVEGWCEHIIKTETGWSWNGLPAEPFAFCPVCGKAKP